jgi:hypothetical protein
MEVKNDVKEPGSYPAGQIKEEIREVPEKILDVVAEDPEEEHVAGNMQQAGVQKHARYQGQEGNFEAGVSRKERRNPGGNRGVREEQGLKGPVRERSLKANRIDKHRDVGKDQRNVDEGIRA